MRDLNIPAEATGLKLHRVVGERLIACEEVHFVDGYTAVERTLRAVQISGRVEIEGKIENHFADLIDRDGTIHATAALDRKSYRALKTRWARCKVQAG